MYHREHVGAFCHGGACSIVESMREAGLLFRCCVLTVGVDRSAFGIAEGRISVGRGG